MRGETAADRRRTASPCATQCRAGLRERMLARRRGACCRIVAVIGV